ncbi:MAG: uracil phosphoribosyltransferase [Promethearchaeota archaeon]
MPLYHYTQKNAIQLLATQSRRADLTPYELSQVHIELGRYLAYQIAEEIPLEEYEILHSQGKAIGKRIKNEKDILIFVFMRAGLYLGEGIRILFHSSPYYHINAKRGIGLTEDEFKSLVPFELDNKIIILVDAVINTGDTMRPVINLFQEKNPKNIIVACSVMPDFTAFKLEKEYPNVNIYTIRISKNSYVGKGKTDTGNRLFGTFLE